MSSFLYRIGRFSARRRWWVIAVWLILAVGGGALSNALGGQLQSSFEIPGTQSQNALDTLEQRFPQLSGASTRIVVATPDGSDISADQDLIVTACEDVAALDDVAIVECPYAMTASGQTPASSGNAAQVSDDGSMVYITADLTVASTAITDTLEDGIERRVNYTPSVATDICGLAAGPDGMLYGSTMISMRLFRVDPTAKADALTDLGRVGWGSGEIYNQLACDGRVYFGSYGGGFFGVYDPSK